MKNKTLLLFLSFLPIYAAASVIPHNLIEPYTKADVGLGNVDNTADADKPIVPHDHPLADILQSGATPGQVPEWSGTAWVPATPSGGPGGGITSLNGLNGVTQTFSTGTSGTDFGISSVGTAHTFNIPTSSASNRGALSSSDWTSFNGKISSSRSISTTAPILGGGDLSADRTLSCQAASGSQAGCLSATDWNTFNNKISSVTGSFNSLAGFDGSGNLFSIPGYGVNSYGGIDSNPSFTFDNRGGGQAGFNTYLPFRPLQNSPNEQWNVFNTMLDIDPDSDGFSMGDTGQSLTWQNVYIKHFGTSDIGQFKFLQLGADIGNGTDPITVNGMQFVNSFMHIYDNVTMSNQIQGYGFTVNVDAAATLNGYTQAFFDNANYSTEAPGYASFNASPNLSSIANNNNYNGLNVNANIPNFTGNASYTGVSLGGNLGTFDTGSYQGIYINPSITSVSNATGLFVDMTNVNATGSKKAAQFNGDVQINGDLGFTGTLALGKLSAYGEQNPIIDGGGNPSSVHTLISGMNIPANDTTANADTIGVNSAMLLTVGANSNVSLGAFGLFSGFALPAVVETHTGSVLPRAQGGTFAINLSGTSTGGTIQSVEAGRFVMIPNGITTVDRSIGVLVESPFGTVGTVNYGIYQTDAERNYFQGTLETEKGVQLKTSGSQPTCDVSHRGMMWNIEGGAGVADIFQICQKTVADTYTWITK